MAANPWQPSAPMDQPSHRRRHCLFAIDSHGTAGIDPILFRQAIGSVVSALPNYQISAYRFYSTSAVYYSGNRLTLIQSEQSIDKYRHKGLSWYAKYTMPVMTMAEFRNLPGIQKMILVPRRLESQFLEETAVITGSDFERTAVKDHYIFYRIKPMQ